MFGRSAAQDNGVQSRAIHSINERWNVDVDAWKGRENIGHAVCKKKYAPFDISVRRIDEDGQVRVTVERMYGCRIHSKLRRECIRKHGERQGWAPFGQWAMGKATKAVRRELDYVVRRMDGRDDASSSSSSESSSSESEADVEDYQWKNVCHNGQCAWKVRGKFDNVAGEIALNQDRASFYLDEATLMGGGGVARAKSAGASGG